MPAWLDDRRLVYPLLLGVMALLTLPNLGAHSLWDIDEGYYCEVSREMLARGDWVMPTFNGKLFAEKPVMVYWLQMVSYSVFGINEFAARFPSALCAVGVLLLTYELARSMFGAGAAWWSALIMASCVEGSLQAHAATPDAPFLLFVMLAFAAFWRDWVRGGNGWLVPFGIATGLAVLTKGPVGLALPAGIVGLFLIWSRSLHRLWNWHLLAGLAALAVVVLPWYALVTWQAGDEFLAEFLGKHNVGRFTQPMQSHRGSVFFQTAGIFVFFAPWSICLIAVVWSAVGSCFTRSKAKPESVDPARQLARDGARILIIWSAAFLIFFSLAATKLPHYVYPLYPALAILTGRFLEYWREGKLRTLHWIAALAWLGIVATGLATIIGFSAVGGWLELPMGKTRLLPGMAVYAWIGLIPLLGALFSLVFYIRGRRTELIWTLSVSSIAFVGAISAWPAMTLDGLKAPQLLAAKAGINPRETNLQVGCYGYFQPSLVYYAQGDVERLESLSAAEKFLSQDTPVCLILPAKTASELHSQAQGAEEVARAFDFYRNYEVVAICNRSGRLACLKQRNIQQR